MLPHHSLFLMLATLVTILSARIVVEAEAKVEAEEAVELMAVGGLVEEIMVVLHSSEP